MFCNALENIIYILDDPCIAWVRNSPEWLVSYKPMRGLPTFQPTQFVTPLSQYATRRIRTGVEAEFILWPNRVPTCKKFYNARLWHFALIPIFEINGSGKDTQPGMKNRKILSKILFFAMFNGFRCKGHFYKRVYECVTASILLLIRILPVN